MYILIAKRKSVPNPRSGNAKKHKIGDILVMSIAAAVVGADTWYDIEEYAVAYEDFFRQYLELPARILSHDTFNGGFFIMDPIALEGNYQEWVKNYVE